MPYFIKKGKTFRLTQKEDLDIREILPIGTYSVGFDACRGEYFLETIDPLEINHKLYGNTTRDADRILSTFKDRSSSTGVLLTGLKGSGKTLLAKKISIKAAEEGIPTIVVNQAFCGDQFNNFFQAISQPTVVLFDEYEKVYCAQKQEHLLTLLDGVYPSQKLFILTCNDKWRVNTNMRNRPGRIFYMLDFDGLDAEFIEEYCQDNLIAKQHIPGVIATAAVFSPFNFDILKAMVEDMNRYNETAGQVMKFLNARPSFGFDQKSYSVKICDPSGKVYAGRDGNVRDWSGNPLKSEIYISFGRVPKTGVTLHQRFSAEDLKQLNNKTQAYMFENKKGYKLLLTPRKTEFEVNFDTLPTVQSDPNTEFFVEKASSEKPEDGGLELTTDTESFGDY